jgi:hypothetical protein
MKYKKQITMNINVGDDVQVLTPDGWLDAVVRETRLRCIIVDVPDPFCIGEMYSKWLKVDINEFRLPTS